MRILIAAAFYPPYRGGYAESVRMLAEGLAARGHRVTVIACDTDQGIPDAITSGVHIVRIPAWNPRILHGSFPLPYPFAAFFAFRRAMREGQDVVSTQTRFFPTTLFGFLFAKAYGVPAIHTERGSVHPASHSALVRFVGKAIDHTAGFFVCRFSDRVIGVSSSAASFSAHLGARDPAVVHNGIDADFWKKPEGHGRSGAPFRIAFVGRLVYAKGVQDLFRAVAALMPDFPLLRVSIVGEGPYKASLQAQARDLGLEDAVSFYGALDPRGVRDILWQADIFANPSYSEGLPRSVLEAAAVGLLIVATDVGGTREIIPDDSYGFLVPAHDSSRLAEAIRRLVADPDLSRLMGRAAHERVKAMLSVTKMVEEYSRINLSCAASRE